MKNPSQKIMDCVDYFNELCGLHFPDKPHLFILQYASQREIYNHWTNSSFLSCFGILNQTLFVLFKESSHVVSYGPNKLIFNGNSQDHFQGTWTTEQLCMFASRCSISYSPENVRKEMREAKAKCLEEKLLLEYSLQFVRDVQFQSGTFFIFLDDKQRMITDVCKSGNHNHFKVILLNDIVLYGCWYPLASQIMLSQIISRLVKAMPLQRFMTSLEIWQESTRQIVAMKEMRLRYSCSTTCFDTIIGDVFGMYRTNDQLQPVWYDVLDAILTPLFTQPIASMIWMYAVSSQMPCYYVNDSHTLIIKARPNVAITLPKSLLCAQPTPRTQLHLPFSSWTTTDFTIEMELTTKSSKEGILFANSVDDFCEKMYSMMMKMLEFLPWCSNLNINLPAMQYVKLTSQHHTMNYALRWIYNFVLDLLQTPPKTYPKFISSPISYWYIWKIALDEIRAEWNAYLDTHVCIATDERVLLPMILRHCVFTPPARGCWKYYLFSHYLDNNVLKEPCSCGEEDCDNIIFAANMLKIGIEDANITPLISFCIGSQVICESILLEENKRFFFPTNVTDGR